MPVVVSLVVDLGRKSQFRFIIITATVLVIRKSTNLGHACCDIAFPEQQEGGICLAIILGDEELQEGVIP